MVNGTIVWNITNETFYNVSAGFNPACVCTGLNTDFGYLFILFMIFLVNSLPKNFYGIELSIDKVYYSKFIAVIAAIVIMSLSTKNTLNIVIYMVLFACLGYLLGEKYIPKKKLKLKENSSC